MGGSRRLPGPGLGEAPSELNQEGWSAPGSVIPFRQRDPSIAAAVAFGRPTASPIRVLVVDEDEDDFLLMEDLLQRAEETRFDVDWATDLEMGIGRLASGEYDVCVCDDRLSRRSGLQLVLMAQRRRCRTPIILMSGSASPELEHEALAQGAVDFIEKEEFDTQRLDRAIRFAVARHVRAEMANELATADPLTGLPGRSAVEDRLERALAAARGRGQTLVVMILGLDGLRTVNDTHGRAGGDEILRGLAERLRGRLREADTVVRLGGDEFALLVEGLGRAEDAALVACKLLEAVALPAKIKGQAVRVTASMGAACFPHDAGGAAGLLRLAEVAMYRAKAEGGNVCCFHAGGPDARLPTLAARTADLRRAIEGGELQLHYQPQVTLASPELGLAALVSWRHPELGLLDLDRLRVVAEEAELVEPLTRWLFEAACGQARQWREMGLTRLHIAVPVLSHRQLGWREFAVQLEACLDQAGLPPHWLELEIDEAVLAEELATGGRALEPLRDLGVRLAVERFGVGSASLNLLRDAPLTTLKLARDLLRDTPRDPKRTHFVGAVVGLARHLGLRLVAEGIESRAQLQMLKAQGCDAVQAFLSCPPLAAEACTGWLRQAAQRA